jgi:nucleoside-diphosphate-sugar epimerase
MNIFFFGSTSFVSQDLMSDLDKKFNVYCTSRKKTKKKNIYNFDLRKKNKDFYNNIKKIDYLFFFASLVPIKESKSTWKDCRETNVYGLINLLKNIKLPIKKIILASSCSLYGSSKSLFNEKSFLKPSSGYALSKLLQEKILKVFCLKNNIKFLAFRLGYVYGNNMNKKRLVRRILLSHKENKKFNIYNKNLNLNLIHTKDISYLITKTFKHAEGIYNLTNYDNITIKNFNDILLGKKIKKNNRINNYSSKNFFNKFPNLKILKLEKRIKQFKDEN